MANITPRDPGFDAAEVTPSDTAEVDARALYIGGTGDVKIKTPGGTTVTFASVPSGFLLPMNAKIVYSTDTTATDIVAIY
jgi:hypothetical protein